MDCRIFVHHWYFENSFTHRHSRQFRAIQSLQTDELLGERPQLVSRVLYNVREHLLFRKSLLGRSQNSPRRWRAAPTARSQAWRQRGTRPNDLPALTSAQAS